MINPIMDQLNQSGSGGIMSMIGSIRNSRNPQQMIANLAAQNPQMRAVMQEIQNHGGDARAAFYEMAQQKGVDPNMILNQLK